jgi:flagellar biogenesis protein FliO
MIRGQTQPRLVGMARGAAVALAVLGAARLGGECRAQPADVPPAVEARPLGVPRDAATGTTTPAAADASGWWRTGAALAGVLALIVGTRFVLAHAARRSGSLAATLGAGGRAPSGVLEVLGRFPVARGQTLVLLRLDRRVLLLAQSSAGMRTLADITDADEVASLVMKTRDDEGASNAARFNQILRQMESDPSVIAAERGGADSPAPRGLFGAPARSREVRA